MRKTLAAILLTLALAAPADSSAQVVISEVGYDVLFAGETKWVELHNTGTSEVDVSSLILCHWPVYSRLDQAGLLSGSLDLQPGAYVVLSWSAIGVGDGEIGLYVDDSFESPSSMIDYMEYGSSGHVRSSVATSAGLWAAGQQVPAANAGETLAVVNPSGSFAAKWASVTPTPGAANIPVSVDGEPAVDQPWIGTAYPNPATDIVSVDVFAPAGVNATSTLYDMLGRQVAREATADGQGIQTLATDVSALPAGVYMLRTTLDGPAAHTLATRAVVVQR